MPELVSKLPQVETSIFSVMSALASQTGALNLSQGFPDFPVSEHLIELLCEKMRSGLNQYAPMPGVPLLRQHIAKKMNVAYGQDLDEENITITCGATQAICSTITALIGSGDEAILFEPAYDSYKPLVELNGGKVRPIQLKLPGFRVDWDEVRDAVNPKTKLIIVNNPHNPTGAVFMESDLNALADIAEEKDLFVLSDEVYEHIVFDGRSHQSVVAHPKLKDRAVATFSFGKTFHATGWKMGYAVASLRLTSEIRKMHQFTTFSINTPAQWAIADYLATPENYLALPKMYESKRDRFFGILQETPFSAQPAEGTYFQIANYKSFSNLPDVEFAKWFTHQHGLATIPLSPFYSDGSDPGLVRFCFAKTEETLAKAESILSSISK